MSTRTVVGRERSGPIAAVLPAEQRLLQRVPLVSTDGIAIVECDPVPRIMWANPALEHLLGAEPGQLRGTPLAELSAAGIGESSPLDLSTLLDLAGHTTWCTLSRHNGSVASVAIEARPLEAIPNGPWCLTIREVSDQVRADELLRTSEERFRALATHAPIGVALSDVGVRLGWINQRLAEMWDRPLDALVGEAWLDHVVSDDRPALLDALVGVLAGSEERVEIRVARPDGARRCIAARITPVELQGRGAGFVASMEDVTEERDRERHLAWQASHDHLTGLANRASLRSRADDLLTGSSPRGAVLFFDLDDFKLVNDSLGHQVGDDLLCEIAERFRRGVRKQDLVARLGGDEFVVLCPDVTDRDEAMLLAERVLSHIARPISIEGTRLHVSASVGVVIAGPGACADDLLRDADVAMYQAKHSGKNRAAFFDEAARKASQLRLDLVSDLRRALVEERIGLAYQPIVSLADRRIVGAEALLRYEHPTLGMIPADQIVAVAEDTGVISDLGACVLRMATQQLERWRKDGAAPDYVSVNLGARQFGDTQLLDLVVHALEEANLAPRDLCIELTETRLMAELHDARLNLTALRRLGVRIALDDFGSGWSSLAYLRRIPAGILKIDRSFIDGLGNDPESAAIVGAVAAMGSALGRTIVAEGIETAEQLEAVIELGCHEVQGYLLGQPVAADKFPLETGLEVPWP